MWFPQSQIQFHITLPRLLPAEDSTSNFPNRCPVSSSRFIFPFSGYPHLGGGPPFPYGTVGGSEVCYLLGYIKHHSTLSVPVHCSACEDRPDRFYDLE